MCDKMVLIEQLRKIETSFYDYFTENDKSIFECIVIKGDNPALVEITDKNLPTELQFVITSINNHLISDYYSYEKKTKH